MDDIDATQAKDSLGTKLHRCRPKGKEHRKMIGSPINNPALIRYTQGAVQNLLQEAYMLAGQNQKI